MMRRALLVLALAMAASAAPAPPAASSICKGVPGSSHLSCYTSNITTQVVTASKLECFNAYIKNATGCQYDVVATGRVAQNAPTTSSYGCGSYIIYSYTNWSCLEGYQAHEKVSPQCVQYAKNGLGLSWNRKTTTLPSADANCTGAGPCPASVKGGAFHLSCYAANESVANVNAAKTQCIGSYLKTNSTCKATANTTGTGYYGCGTYIAYGFTTQACLDGYQNQEKINTNCKLYNNYQLGAAWNRMNTTLSSAGYTCPYNGSRRMHRLRLH